MDDYKNSVESFATSKVESDNEIFKLTGELEEVKSQLLVAALSILDKDEKMKLIKEKEEKISIDLL